MAALASDRDGVAADPARPACIRTLLEKASALRRGVTPDAAAVSNVWRQRTAVVQAAMDPEVAGSSAAPARRPRPASAAPARRVGGVAGSASAPLVACCEPARITDSPGSPTRRAAETTLHRQFLARVSQLHADAFASAAADVGFGALSGGAPTLTDTLASRMSSSAGRTRPMSATMYSSSRASLHGTSAPARQPFRAVPRGRSQFVDADAQYDAVTCTDGAEAVEPPPGGFTLVFHFYSGLFSAAKQLNSRVPTYEEMRRADNTMCFGEILFLMRDLGLWPALITRAELRHIFDHMDERFHDDMGDGSREHFDPDRFTEFLARVFLCVDPRDVTALRAGASLALPSERVAALARLLKLDDPEFIRSFIKLVGVDTKDRLNLSAGIAQLPQKRAKQNLLVMAAAFDGLRGTRSRDAADTGVDDGVRVADVLESCRKRLWRTRTREDRLRASSSEYSGNQLAVLQPLRHCYASRAKRCAWQSFGDLFMDMSRVTAGKRYKYRVVVTSKCARHIRVHAVAVDLPQVTLMYAPTLLAPGMAMNVDIVCVPTAPGESLGHIEIVATTVSSAGVAGDCDTLWCPVYVRALDPAGVSVKVFPTPQVHRLLSSPKALLFAAVPPMPTA